MQAECPIESVVILFVFNQDGAGKLIKTINIREHKLSPHGFQKIEQLPGSAWNTRIL